MVKTIPAVQVINERIENMPINKSELARQIGLNDYELLRRTLNGERKLTGDELVNICVILGIEISDFVTKT